jgi:prepilin-type processing-associated H-X9-DG protein
MAGENMLVGYSVGSPVSGGLQTNWACPFPNFCVFIGSDKICATTSNPNLCDAAPLAPTAGAVDGPNWVNANAVAVEKINYGYKLTVEGSFPYLNSNHGGGVNTVFCDGACRFIKDTIDGTVYSKLITPAGSRLPDMNTQMPVSEDAFAN